MFDVNRVRNKEGDLLIHVAVKGGVCVCVCAQKDIYSLHSAR